MGGVGGVVATPFIVRAIDAVNPVEQYRQVQIISDNILDDNDVNMDRDILKITNTLATVLSNLDE